MKSERAIVVKDELIARYLAGEANAEEAEAIHDWMEHSDNRAHFAALEAAWHAAHPEKQQRPVSKLDAWEDLHSRMETTSPRRKPGTAFLWLNNAAFKIAASVLLTVIAGLLIYIRMRERMVPEVVVSTQESTQAVSFPDHSIATLYRDTKISYPENFKKDIRNVNLLAGEAFFEVTHNSDQPFRVHTTAGDVNVIGTAFNVALHDNSLEVSVKEGRVLMYTSGDSSFLTAGFTGIVRSGQAIQTLDSVNANAWGYATRRFVFKDTPLYQVIADLEKAYPYTIEVTQKNITRCKLTATFENDSAENLLNLIAEPLNLLVRKNGKVFILEGEGCP